MSAHAIGAEHSSKQISHRPWPKRYGMLGLSQRVNQNQRNPTEACHTKGQQQEEEEDDRQDVHQRAKAC